ncbi:hypothetical protein SARC_04186 [Sphaeroforma arctica JP610]|uniref:Uncharacterized protein n=1 Tax=Sphaeroforma arctica JP610 TaxID=667725 RepID=A0A0L0G388_9EUKA|nr:hypothetical protein SARC_04186 [Sphaeroforma arctica JP610]KNC83562.1 hypothetical protein SARC_04186 [Sphaeroforma arctica JP610]|eukprot:XP_014157464.1 hypothetical protein SARC_04186 [Sphaeroforma arctica JP610]
MVEFEESTDVKGLGGREYSSQEMEVWNRKWKLGTGKSIQSKDEGHLEARDSTRSLVQVEDSIRADEKQLVVYTPSSWEVEENIRESDDYSHSQFPHSWMEADKELQQMVEASPVMLPSEPQEGSYRELANTMELPRTPVKKSVDQLLDKALEAYELELAGLDPFVEMPHLHVDCQEGPEGTGEKVAAFQHSLEAPDTIHTEDIQPKSWPNAKQAAPDVRYTISEDITTDALIHNRKRPRKTPLKLHPATEETMLTIWGSYTSAAWERRFLPQQHWRYYGCGMKAFYTSKPTVYEQLCRTNAAGTFQRM